MDEFLPGAFSGLSQNIVGHPFDTAKVYIQNNKPLNTLKPLQYYRGFIYPTIFSVGATGLIFSINELINKKVDNYFMSGFIGGLITSPLCYGFDLFKIKRQIPGAYSRKLYGLGSTITRESIAYSFYFGTYFKMTKEYKQDPFISGGIAGLLAWTFSYPVDVVKNRQMAKNITLSSAIKEGRLWRGYSLCATRAIVVNSVGFKTYDYFKNHI